MAARNVNVDRIPPIRQQCLVWSTIFLVIVIVVLQGTIIFVRRDQDHISPQAASENFKLMEGWSLASAPLKRATYNKPMLTNNDRTQAHAEVSGTKSYLVKSPRAMSLVQLQQSSSTNASAHPISLTQLVCSSPWRTSKSLPEWMKEYFVWHQEARRRIAGSFEKWKHYEYLVVRCLASDRRCGGAADRLRSLPTMLLLAHRLKRLLFYHWEIPAPLTEFLLPPSTITGDGGRAVAALDWRWPPHPKMAEFQFEKRACISNGDVVNFHLNYTDPKKSPGSTTKTPRQLKRIATVLYQSHNHGSVQYDALRDHHKNEKSFDQVFRDVWHSVFCPTAPIQQRIHQQLQQLQLTPNHFHGLHLRTRYARDLEDFAIQIFAQAAVRCLSTLINDSGGSFQLTSSGQTQQVPQPKLDPKVDYKVFVASDNINASLAAIQYCREMGLPNGKMVAASGSSRNNNITMVHLDRGTAFLSQKAREFTLHHPSQYYDTWVDLYILSMARCIVYGPGNYGKLANLLSTDIYCYYDLLMNPITFLPLKHCTWGGPF